MTKLTLEEFIEKSESVHGDKYDYSLVEYVNSGTKVKIVCKEHGVFEQTPYGHYGKTSCCPKCSYTDRGKSCRLTIEEFKEKAKNVHGNLYNYDLVEYVNAKAKVKIICKKHGEFNQQAGKHLDGNGCIECGGRRKTTKKEFIKIARTVHGNVYDYSLVEYKNSKTKVDIICPTHGIFCQIPSGHMNGKRCKKCANNLVGWTYTKWEEAGKASKYFDSFKVYIIECWNRGEKFYKIGKTFNTLDRRFNCNEMMPYEFKVLEIIEGSSRDISELENRLQVKNKEFRYTPVVPFKGMYECFSKIINNGE